MRNSIAHAANCYNIIGAQSELVQQVKDEGKEMDRGQDSDDMLRVIDMIENHQMIFLNGNKASFSFCILL